MTPDFNPDLKPIAKTPDGMDIVSMINVNGYVFVATQRHIYRLAQRRKGHFALVPIRFSSEVK